MAFIDFVKKGYKAGKAFLSDDGPKLSYENTQAAFNVIKLKTENRILILSSLASIIFLGIYGYLIYLNVNPYSLRHIIIYSILGVILLGTLLINLILNPVRRNKMSSVEKDKAKKIKNTWKNIALIISTLTKLVSLGFMLYEIITIDSSIKRLIPFGASTLALLVQLAISYISRLIVSYYEILLVGIDKDIQSSAITKAIAEVTESDPIKVAGNIKSSHTAKISEELEEQVNTNKAVKEKDFKDLLYKAASYCRNNPITVDGIMSRFDIGIMKATKVLVKLEKLGIISKGPLKAGRILITDTDTIKHLIYKEK